MTNTRQGRGVIDVQKLRVTHEIPEGYQVDCGALLWRFFQAELADYFPKGVPDGTPTTSTTHPRDLTPVAEPAGGHRRPDGHLPLRGD